MLTEMLGGFSSEEEFRGCSKGLSATSRGMNAYCIQSSASNKGYRTGEERGKRERGKRRREKGNIPPR